MKYSVKLLANLEKSGRERCIIYAKDLDNLRLKNFKIIKKFSFIKAVVCEIDKVGLDELIKNENCIYIAEHKTVSTLDSGTESKEVSGGIDPSRVRIEEKTEGSVAFIDTGISEIADFVVPKKRLIAFVDLINHQKNPYDDNGHGTFVAGVCSANGIATAGKIVGSAPTSDIVAIKAIDQMGEGGAVKVLEAMQWIFDNHKRLKIRVVCMSFGTEPQKNDPLVRGANALIEQGIVVVGASGNNGDEVVLSPASAENVVSVGAVDNEGEIASFTSHSKEKPEFYAKGVDIEGFSIEKGIVRMSGTSVACPYVAGKCFKLACKFNNLPPKMLKNSLYKQVKKINGINVFI